MLFHYLDHKRKESSAPLHATYLVTGKWVENGNTVSQQYKSLLHGLCVDVSSPLCFVATLF